MRSSVLGLASKLQTGFGKRIQAPNRSQERDFHNKRLSHTHDSHDRQGADDGFLGKRIRRRKAPNFPRTTLGTGHHTPSLKSLCGGGVPSSHPSLAPNCFFLSFWARDRRALEKWSSARVRSDRSEFALR